MKKILILGSNGMLGSQLYKSFSSFGHLVYGYTRSGLVSSKKGQKLPVSQDIFEPEFARMLEELSPNHVINCIGIIKQRKEARQPELAVKINSLLPHILSSACLARNINFIHFSTDCVFSGNTGNYSETSVPDARDLYGLSKILGETWNKTSVTLRTSIIGHEPYNKKSLLEWALSQKNQEVKGFKNAIFSGLTTLEIANILEKHVLDNSDIRNSLFHLSGHSISKYALLELISREYELGLKIIATSTPAIDRSLNSLLFRQVTNYKIKGWGEMIKEMKDGHQLSKNQL